MQDNNIHINREPDVFSKIIKGKLESHQLPVDAECWNEIEARLNANKSKRFIPFWLWISGGAAVASLALLLMLRPVDDSLNNAVKLAHRAVIQCKSIQAKKTKDHQINSVTVTKESINNKEQKNNYAQLIRTQVAQSDGTNSEKELVVAIDVASDSVRNNQATVSAVNNHTNTLIAQITSETKDSVVNINKKKYIANSLIEESTNEPIVATKSNRNWLLAASVGPSGATNLSGGGSGALYAVNDNKYLTNATTNYTDIMSLGNFTQKKYNPALSFGLLMRRDLNKTLSVESGLQYSYLQSTFNQPIGWVTYDASLTLHYLGIPVNLIAKLWKNQKWEIYLSGGEMVEKGLRSVYIQNQRSGNQTITTTASTKIDGLQWSVNSGLGVAYKIQPRLGLYFEPKISYFFDNNQPVSTRTDQPVVFGLSAGLRFEL